MSARSLAVFISAALVVTGASSSGAVAPEQPPAAAHATSAAAPEWGPIVRVGKNAWGSRTVVDARGTVTVLWAMFRGAIKVRQHPAGHGWTKVQTIGHGEIPELAVDARGNVTAVWIHERPGFTTSVMAARHPVGGEWSAPIRISRDIKLAAGQHPYGARILDIAAGPRAGVVVAWDWGSGKRYRWRIQVASLPPGGRWQPPVTVTPANGSQWPQVGVDGHGTTVLAYGAPRPKGVTSVKVRERPAGGTWSGATALGHGVPYFTQLAVNRAGDAMVSFVPKDQKVAAAFRPRGKAWQAAERVFPPGVPAEYPSLGLTGSGASVVAAIRGDQEGVAFVRRPPAGPWSAPRRMGTEVTADVSLATNEDGDVLVIWGFEWLYATYHPAGGSWTDQFTVAPYYDALEAVTAAVAPDGAAVALWDMEGKPLQARQLTP